VETGHRPKGLVLNPESTRRYADELIEASGLPKESVFDSAGLAHQETRDAIAALEPDIGISILYGQIIRPNVIDLFPNGIVNLHPGLLPYNRGAYPNVWGIIDKTPAGVTLHYIDEGLDTGDIIAQRDVEVLPIDTGKSLYQKLVDAMLEIFKNEWPGVLNSEQDRTPQDHALNTSHKKQDVTSIDCINLDSMVRAGDLIDLIRARTFPPYSGCYFEHEGRLVAVTIDLSYVDE